MSSGWEYASGECRLSSRWTHTYAALSTPASNALTNLSLLGEAVEAKAPGDTGAATGLAAGKERPRLQTSIAVVCLLAHTLSERYSFEGSR